MKIYSRIVFNLCWIFIAFIYFRNIVIRHGFKGTLKRKISLQHCIIYGLTKKKKAKKNFLSPKKNLKFKILSPKMVK